MELFDSVADTGGEPLAYRMRPLTIDEFEGQEHIVGPGRLLRRVIQADQLSSLIFYGPPGTGKTTLARVIANTTKSHFITMNAVLSGVKDLRASIEEAKEHRSLHGRRTILFVDEVHRWNKAQQDALLPWVENGTVILIGATTQNPYFEVNSALVSRSRIFQLKALTEENLRDIARRALKDPIRGYGRYDVILDDDALDHLVNISNGDARSLLNAVELAVETTPASFPPEEGSTIHVTLEIAEESIQRKVVLYDKEGDYHFDTISAFIKSLRGSDPDAALYWMARMIYAGEDPHYVFRRMLILASEDVGLADPQAIVVVEAAAAAFDRVGMPEGQFHLAEAALYLANAPKSNTSLAYFDALSAVQTEMTEEVPSHLRDASRDSEGFGHGEGYVYPHAYRDHWVAQQYLPAGLQGRMFYQPSEQGFEASIRQTVMRRREAQLAATAPDAPEEILTFSPPDKNRDRWLARITNLRSRNLEELRTEIFELASLKRHDRVLDLNAQSGLLLFEAVRRVPEGGVWGIVEGEEDREVLQHYEQNLPEEDRPTILSCGILDGIKRLSNDSGVAFEAIVGRNPLTRIEERLSLFVAMLPLLATEGRIVIAQTIPSKSQRLSRLVSLERLPLEVTRRFLALEEEIYESSFRETDLEEACTSAGLVGVSVTSHCYRELRSVEEKHVRSWFSPSGNQPSFASRLAGALSPEEIALLEELFLDRIVGTQVEWETAVALLSARRSSGNQQAS